MKTFLTLLAAAVLILATQFQPSTSAAEDTPSTELNRFAGKIVIIYIAGRTESPLYVENVRIETIGDTTVLSGRVSDFGGDENWTKGADTFVALDHVESIFGFTPEAFDKQVREATGQPDKNNL